VDENYISLSARRGLYQMVRRRAVNCRNRLYQKGKGAGSAPETAARAVFFNQNSRLPCKSDFRTLAEQPQAAWFYHFQWLA
jgi:hypothetical protein